MKVGSLMSSTTLAENLNKQIQDLQKKIDSLTKVKDLINIYPDLTERRDRWRNVFYSSSMVNSKVEHVDFKYACGCCSDAPLLAYFYKIEEGIKVYADPYSICIGEQNAYGIGVFPSPSWEKLLKEHNIPQSMEALVGDYFSKNLPENFDDEDYDD